MGCSREGITGHPKKCVQNTQFFLSYRDASADLSLCVHNMHLLYQGSSLAILTYCMHITLCQGHCFVYIGKECTALIVDI